MWATAARGTYLPVDEAQYREFVEAVVERYDGDGIEDMPGLANPIRHWQLDNEPLRARSGFAELQRMTYSAIKEVCDRCVVLIGGVPGMPPVSDYLAGFDGQYRPILDALAGRYVETAASTDAASASPEACRSPCRRGRSS